MTDVDAPRSTPATGGADDADAVVVGGGVAGLVAARELALAGLRVVVLEAGQEVGGAVGRHAVAGLVLDTGAESFATRGGVVAALAGELGLGAAVTAPAPLGAWVELPSGPGTLPRAGLLGVPADPWAADVRRTIGLPGAVRATADRLLPAHVGTGADATLGSLVRSRMGRRVLDRLVTPVVAGVHSADPADLDVRAVAPGLLPAVAAQGSLGAAVASLRALAPAGSAVGGLVGGMHTLVDALVRDLRERGATVEVGCAVSSVTRDPRGWSLAVTGRSGEGVLRAPRLVLAAPAAAALDLLAPAVPRLAGVRTDPGADVVLATLVVDAPDLDGAPRGTGVLVSPAAQRDGGRRAGRHGAARGARHGAASADRHDAVRAKALTHATAKWPWLAERAGPGRHVLRLSYGRAGGTGTLEDVTALSPDELTDVAVRDAGRLLGVPLDAGHVVGAARARWSQSLPQPSAAHREAVEAVVAAVAEQPGLEVCGAWVAGNGLAAVVPQARAAGRRLADENQDPGRL